MAAQLVQLYPGQSVERWIIDKKLGEGGFGAVYRVKDQGGMMYAMKVEGCNEQIQVLKLEVSVLNDLAARGNRHFCKIEDKGRFDQFNYVVMTLVGKSLQDLIKAAGGRFSLNCSIGIGIQALEALEDMHAIGYLHRDVKPGNYTIGRMELNEIAKVYILDFGMCRKYTNASGVMRKPRQAAGFRGTVKYAPQSCHKQRELCRKDDLETWMYMQVELTYGMLPWANIQDMNQVGAEKDRIRGCLATLFPPPCPPIFVQIMQYIDALKFFDPPNYQQVYGMMRQAYNGPERPYDWEGNGPAAKIFTQ